MKWYYEADEGKIIATVTNAPVAHVWSKQGNSRDPTPELRDQYGLLMAAAPDLLEALQGLLLLGQREDALRGPAIVAAQAALKKATGNLSINGVQRDI
jgi:hypothetical protein